MLAATIRVVQVLDVFEVRAVISRFSPGEDPEQFASRTLTVKLPDEMGAEDDLSIIIALLALWSESTIRD